MTNRHGMVKNYDKFYNRKPDGARRELIFSTHTAWIPDRAPLATPQDDRRSHSAPTERTDLRHVDERRLEDDLIFMPMPEVHHDIGLDDIHLAQFAATH